MSHLLYAVRPGQTEREVQRMVAACRAQGIDRITILGSITGKLTASLEQLRVDRARWEKDGFGVSAMIYAIGHPDMGRFYDQEGRASNPVPVYRGPRVLDGSCNEALLPEGWRYAVNEHGNPIYCCACPDEVWLRDNVRLAGELAGVFEELWYDDEFRTDGDQGAGAPHRSTASCYCDRCMERLSARVGRAVTRAEVISDKALHEEWVQQKVEVLSGSFGQLVESARSVRAGVSVGLMVRWGGEERDGIDIDRLRPSLGIQPLLRAGEGHFEAADYAQPLSQAMEYLACSYHVGWFPKETEVLSETTYFAPMPRHAIVKKAALALAAGTGRLSYCPCVDGFVHYQWFIEQDRALLERCAEAFADKTAQYRPIQLLRTPAAGWGDADPVRRVKDRMYFPLFTLAGMNTTVVRQGGWKDRKVGALAITGRSAWDWAPQERSHGPLIVDGLALLEQAPLNEWLGVTTSGTVDGSGRVEARGSLEPDGMLLRRGELWVIPYVWHAVPELVLPELLRDLRRVLGPVVGSAFVQGDLEVMLVHHRGEDRDALMLVNLCEQVRRVTLHPAPDRRTLARWDGEESDGQLVLGPHEVRLLRAC